MTWEHVLMGLVLLTWFFALAGWLVDKWAENRSTSYGKFEGIVMGNPREIAGERVRSIKMIYNYENEED